MKYQTKARELSEHSCPKKKVDKKKKMEKIPRLHPKHDGIFKISVANPGPRIRCLFDPLIRIPVWVKIKIRIRNLDMETIFWVKILKFFCGNPGWKKFESGIRDKHPRSANLLNKYLTLLPV
jgi:hypothetical protein